MERVPPSSELSESGLIGCLLTKPAKVMLWCQEAAITEDHFYAPANRLIYRQLIKLSQTLGPDRIDLIIVATELTKAKELDLVGGEQYMRRLIEEVTTVQHAQFYIEEVRDKWIRRTALEELKELEENLHEAPDPAEEIVSNTLADIISLSHKASEGQAYEYSYEDSVAEFHKAKTEGAVGVPCSLPGFNKFVRSYRPGKLYILAGGTSEGKTTLAIQDTVAIGEGRGPVAYQTLEMPEREIRDNFIFHKARLDANKFEWGTWTDEELSQFKEAGEALKSAPIFVNDRPSTFGQSAAYITEMVATQGIVIAFVDYLQLLQNGGFGSGQRKDLRGDEIIQAWTSGYKNLAKRLNIPIVVLSQFGRRGHRDQTEAPPLPTLEALKGSSSIEQDADVVMTISKKPGTPMAEFKSSQAWPMVADVPKQRGGPTGEKEIQFLRNQKRFVAETQWKGMYGQPGDDKEVWDLN